MSRREVYTIPKRWQIPTQINKTTRLNLYWIKKDFITKLWTYTSIQLFPTNKIICILAKIYELDEGEHDSKEVADTDANKQNCKTESILN